MRQGRRAVTKLSHHLRCLSALRVLVGVLGMFGLLAGCRSNDVYQSAAAPPKVTRMQMRDEHTDGQVKQVSSESSRLPEMPPNGIGVRVVARVNDMPILEQEVRNSTVKYELQLANAPEPMRSERIREARQSVLQRLIERELVLSDLYEKVSKTRPQYLEKLHEIAGQQFRKHLKTVKKSIEEATHQPVETDQQVREILESQGISFDAYRRQFERDFISVEYLRARIFPLVKSAVGHQEIVDYYEEHAQEFEVIDQVQWQHIFIDEKRYDNRAAAHKLAQSLARQAYHGANFRQLIKNFDNGDSSYLGDQDKVSRRGEIFPVELEQHLFRMRDGQVGPIVEAPNGYHVFKLIKRDYAGRKPLTEEIQTEIRKQLQGKAANLQTRHFVDELKLRAAIEILDESLLPDEKSAQQK